MRRGTNANYILLSAIMSVQEKLKVWNKEHFGNCMKLVDSIREKLMEIQSLPHLDSHLVNESKLQNELDENLLRMDIMWKQKSRIAWLKDGDENTKFFHLTTIINRRYNRINSIQDSSSRWLTESVDIEKCLVNFFKNQFEATHTTCPMELGNLCESVISGEDNEKLCCIPDEEEIKDALWTMGAQKSPGPDGMPPFFYKQYWDIVKVEVFAFVKLFFQSKHLVRGFNHTFITLIKKTDKPSTPEHYRPIALCNVSYKIISKILSCRLKVILDRVVSINQSAFVPGRNINDNTIISNEIMHFLHKNKSKVGFMAIKIDMAKAYDRVDWSALLCIMKNFGFAAGFIDMVHGCVSSVTYSVLVNGSPVGNFKASRGIRQGDPLSPYLFIILFKLLSRMIKEAEDEGKLQGIKICRNAPAISHLMYADDLVIFCRANQNDAEIIEEILSRFELWTGQQVNKTKSTIHFGKHVHTDVRKDICTTLNLVECNHKSKHLGLPFCRGRSKTSDFEYVVDHVKNKFKGWKGKVLSQSSRAVLIKSVLQAIPAYSMQTVSLPNSICDKIDTISRRFFWGVAEDKKHYLSLVAWDQISKPKQAGGLGFRKMKDQNVAFTCKLTWQMISAKDKLWSRMLACKYLKHLKIQQISSFPRDCSWIWQTICKNIEFIKLHSCSTIGDGTYSFIWDDAWVPSLPGFKPASNLRTPTSPTMVKELITSTGIWDSNLLDVHFPPEVCTEIMKINIPPSVEPPTPIWIPSKAGNFTVKSAYTAVMDRRLTSSGSIPRGVWKKIWCAKLHGRLKHFLWRIMVNGIPVNARLGFLPGMNTKHCVLCEEQEETLDHIFMHCKMVKCILFGSKWNFKFLDSDVSIKEWFVRWFNNACSNDGNTRHREEFLNFLLVSFDHLWRIRNQVCFNRLQINLEQLVKTISKIAEEYWRAQVKKMFNDKAPTDESAWCPPMNDAIKINCDAAILKGMACAAWIARDHKGSVLKASACCYPLISVDEAEARAALEAIMFGAELPNKRIIIESDSLNTVKAFTGQKVDKDRLTSHLVSKAQAICRTRNMISIIKIPRVCNMAAHKLARWACNNNLSGPIPPHFIPDFVLEDGVEAISLVDQMATCGI